MEINTTPSTSDDQVVVGSTIFCTVHLTSTGGSNVPVVLTNPYRHALYVNGSEVNQLSLSLPGNGTALSFSVKGAIVGPMVLRVHKGYASSSIFNDFDLAVLPVPTSQTVAKIQVKVGTSWQDWGGVHSFLKGRQVQLKAVPSSGAFPSGQPAWSANSAVSLSTSSGTYCTATFNQVSDSTAPKDWAIITASSGGTSAKAEAIVGEVGLDSVDFANNYRVLKDDGSGGYGTDLPNAIIEWENGQPGAPLCYSGGQSLKAQAYFWVNPSGFNASGIKVQGKATGYTTDANAPFIFPLQGLTQSSNLTYYSSAEATPALSTTCNVFKPLQVLWQAKLNGGWSDLGQSSNKLYRVWKTPLTDQLYRTVLEVACRDTQNHRGAPTIVSKLWGGFTDRNVGNADGVAMKYWANSDETLRIALAEQSCQGLAQMIIPGPRIIQLAGSKNPATGKPYQDDMAGVGTCAAWTDLLFNALRAQGVANCSQFELRPSAIFITPSSTGGVNQRGGFLVNNWQFAATGNAPAASKPPWTHLLSEVTDLPGLRAQGNVSNPKGAFFNHYLIRYGGQFYDPSYGAGPRSSPRSWENKSVAGFANSWSGTKVAKKNNTAVQEMQFHLKGTPKPPNW